MVRYDVIPNPRWRTAAIMKIENAQYLRRRSSDLHQILQVDVDAILYITLRRADLSASAELLVLICYSVSVYFIAICLVLVMQAVTLVLVLVLHVWCCVLKHGLVTLVIIMILKDTTFQIIYS